ncbi:MAG: polysaccharide deacetylase family protein [Clostridia bacterium]|nr:polysaccharide deacetylase family protein [Clostridia bacterium]
MKSRVIKLRVGMPFIIVAVLLVAAAALFASGAIPGIAAASSAQRLIPIYNVDCPDKRISVSFDAAWGNEDTQKLIDILEQFDVKATFFVVGQWVDKYPESVQALHDAGHEIMNHSDTHPHMPQLSRQQMLEEINACNRKISAITGEAPSLLRAPYGEYSNALIEVLDSIGMKCIQWDVDSLDWKELPASEISDRVLSRVKPGSIVLFHNAAIHTPEALPTILESLQSDGYEIVPVSRLIYHSGYTIDNNGKQFCVEPQG